MSAAVVEVRMRGSPRRVRRAAAQRSGSVHVSDDVVGVAPEPAAVVAVASVVCSDDADVLAPFELGSPEAGNSGAWEGALPAELGPGSNPGAGPGAEDDPSLLSEQLQSRRQSSLGASTSGAHSNGSSGGAGGGGGAEPGLRAMAPGPLTRAGRNPAAVLAALPTFPPRGLPALVGPPGAGVGAGPVGLRPNGGPPSSPSSFPNPSAASGAAPSSPVAMIPSSSAVLYAGSSVAANMSATVANSDVLVSQLDALQLENVAAAAPDSGGAAAAAAVRVYKSGLAAGVAAAAERHAAAAGKKVAPGAGGVAVAGAVGGKSPRVEQRRVRARVLDRSELLLARDEAVRSELLGRTWQDLLRFEERLSIGGKGQGVNGGQQEADARARDQAGAKGRQQQRQQQQQVQPEEGRGQPAQAVPPSLDDLLAWTQQQVTPEQLQRQQEARQQQLVRAAAEAEAEAEARDGLLNALSRAVSWRQLRWVYNQSFDRIQAAHLARMLRKLAIFFSTRGVPRCHSDAFYELYESVLQRLVVAGPDLTAAQAVEAVGAMAGMPLNTEPRVRSTVLALQSVLRSSQRAVMPPPPQPAGGLGGGGGVGTGSMDGGGGGGGGGGSILTASRAAVRQARAGGAAAGGAAAGGSSSPNPYSAAAAAAAPPPPLSGPQYAQLAYNLGRISTRARPFRLSLRLPDSFARGLLLCSYATLPSMGAAGCARLLYGTSKLRLHTPTPWLFAFYRASARHLVAMSVPELTLLLYGACRLPYKPPPPWLEAYLAITLDGGRPEPLALDPPFLANLLHALGRLRFKPRPAVLEALLEAVGAALRERSMSPCEMSQALRGLAWLGVAPEEAWLEALWAASGPAMEAGAFNPAQLANLAYALGVLKVPIPRRWYRLLVGCMRAAGPARLRPYHRRRFLAALHAFGCTELPAW
ncbi:Tbc2 translation factor, chloroplastic [Tetrabaena socialis]|uniref:Tbc2 translation factor, chloroplastic n=1 Tax=Tetrabaena socialis TaxID=47790 RepID=A0A2J7ZNH7_9CHLO|nr:Tbc2 translation factor, chloroplastic [Tetrabaena socialis]|eukprot:PNH01831.1 Tbc2 translation factor, chloroplastic [Tetrabaena socialis]